MIAPRQDYVINGKMDWQEFAADALIEILSFGAKWGLLFILFTSLANGYLVTALKAMSESVCPLIK